MHLGVPEGHDVIYVESLRARDTVPVPSRLGGRWPMHATGTGLVLLAHSAQEFQEEVLASKLRRYTANTLTDPDALRHFLAGVRKSGVAIVEGQLTLGAMAVAVPIRGPHNRVVAAVGITVPSGSTSPHSLVPALAAASRSISRALGAPSAEGGTARPPLRWRARAGLATRPSGPR
ncbi:IclR family transcriptional regulator [Thermocatellispora tengchongensis]